MGTHSLVSQARRAGTCGPLRDVLCFARAEAMSYPSAEDVAASLPHFDDAVKYINGLPKEPPVPGVELTSQEEKLGYYALFKVGTVGKVSSKRPGMFDKAGQFKWDAWKA